MRIARALSVLGRASRREAERLVADGRVSLNDVTLHDPATLVDLAQDRVSVDGELISSTGRRVYLALHKPPGVVSTVRDPHAERTVMELVPDRTRLFPVGRLDKQTEGLIILTNDGLLANTVMHPRYETEREYLALVEGEPKPGTLAQLRRGVKLDGETTAPAEATIERREGTRFWVRLVLREGKNHEVRRMLESVGHPVERLIRTRIGPVELGNLRSGAYRPLRDAEVRALFRPAERAAYRATARAARLARLPPELLTSNRVRGQRTPSPHR